MILKDRRILLLMALLLFTRFSFEGEEGEEKVLNLPIGNPKVKNRVLDIHPDEIQSSLRCPNPPKKRKGIRKSSGKLV